MPKPSTEPLLKITLNLFHSDIVALRSRYGHGYTEQIRLMVRKNVNGHKSMKRTIEDYLKEDLDE